MLKENLSGSSPHGFILVSFLFLSSLSFFFVPICTVGKTTNMLRHGLTVEKSP